MRLVLAAVHVSLPWAAPLVVLLAISAATAMPSTPGHVGTLELAAVGALMLLGVGREQALAFALLYHAMQVIPVTLIGLSAARDLRSH
jgi:uncharacterized membrane protein YbhN (UPF0104 family)